MGTFHLLLTSLGLGTKLTSEGSLISLPPSLTEEEAVPSKHLDPPSQPKGSQIYDLPGSSEGSQTKTFSRALQITLGVCRHKAFIPTLLRPVCSRTHMKNAKRRI